MKRKTKNIIMIIISLLMVGVIAFTIYNEKKFITINDPNFQNGMQSMNQSNSIVTPPDMQNWNVQNNENKKEVPNQNNESLDKQNGNSMNPNENNNANTPPEIPNGSNGGIPPEKPDGNMPNNMNNGISNDNSCIYIILFGIESLILSCILGYLIMSGFNKKNLKETFISNDKKIIYLLTVIILTTGFTFGASTIRSNLSNNNENNNQQNNGNSSNITYSSKNEIKESTTVLSGEYTSSATDENAILVSGDIDVTLSDITVSKTGDSDGGDNTSFYGTNSGIIAKDGATLTLKNINVSTNATGANGVFSYGGSATTNNSNNDGTAINISDSKITTTKDNSGGIMTTGGGIMNASNLDITTFGISSAAIRTDRGGGTVVVDGGTYKTIGAGSPTVYSTADITVKNADLTATASEGIVIEGKNKVTLENVTLTDTNNKLNGLSTTYKNIFLYQSMSGDASVGISEFSSKNSIITTNKGDTFYVTNTSSKITLNNNKIINNDKTGNFLRVQKDSWGNSGSNGGNVTLLISNQEVTGNIVIDSISTLDMTMEKNSYYEGTINGDNSAKEIKLTLDESSKIKLTGDCYVTSLDNADSSYSNIYFNGYKIYVNGKSIN
ncbi:MAG: hypothetical protein NC181_02260 [Clostridium sp.]|nr:hypothetical protein [Clostridium sp.]MCM1443708.1 hypothetical protein [Candidatus Amulumruptor caecigallinarius]